MRAKSKKHRVNVDYDDMEHVTVKRRAKAAKKSMHQYIVDLTVYGKLQTKSLKA